MAAAAATTEADLMVPIRLFIDTFNHGDLPGAEAMHLPTGVVIIDEPARTYGKAPARSRRGRTT